VTAQLLGWRWPRTGRYAGLSLSGHVAPTGGNGAVSARCAAPTGQCFAGAFHGSLHGTTKGSLLSVTPTQQPDVVLIDASFTIHAPHGDLNVAHEQIVYNTAPSSDGEFSILGEVTSGTGRYAGATGYVMGVGTRPLSTGVATGSYVGEITLG